MRNRTDLTFRIEVAEVGWLAPVAGLPIQNLQGWPVQSCREGEEKKLFCPVETHEPKKGENRFDSKYGVVRANAVRARRMRVVGRHKACAGPGVVMTLDAHSSNRTPSTYSLTLRLLAHDAKISPTLAQSFSLACAFTMYTFSADAANVDTKCTFSNLFPSSVSTTYSYV